MNTKTRTLTPELLDKIAPANPGAVVSVRGSIVNVRFEGALPPIHSLLHAKEGEIIIEVLAQLDRQQNQVIVLALGLDHIEPKESSIPTCRVAA